MLCCAKCSRLFPLILFLMIDASGLNAPCILVPCDFSKTIKFMLFSLLGDVFISRWNYVHKGFGKRVVALVTFSIDFIREILPIDCSQVKVPFSCW